MAEIVNFPTKSVRDWLIVERALNDILSQARVSPAAHARIIDRMKAFYSTLDNDFTFSVNASFPHNITEAQAASLVSQIGEKLVVDLSEQLHAFTYKLFVERLNVEAELCGALGV
ncbi:MAG: hypothetical protein ABR929_13745 [Roseiarcus sp.]|jgi:uncharacterized FlaG/YvyC family protein